MLKQILNIFIPHKNNAYKPHAISHYGLFVVAISIIAVQAVYNVQNTGQLRVLGYATNVSVGELHSLTNSNRSANGLSGLSLNSQLNSSAQSKANHMISNNYWAHNAPDGTTPWYFFAAAGYNYSKAGENLAYGYSTSSGVMSGWMNSPSHAANILDSEYKEVGFGIADGSNFQGGENTVVVAHYATPVQSAQPKPKPATTKPQPQTTPAVAQAQTQTEPVSPTPAPVVEEEQQEKPKAKPIEQPAEAELEQQEVTQRYLARLSEDGTIIVTGGDSANVSSNERTTNLEALLNGEAHWSLYFTAITITTLGMVYFIRHMHAIYQLIKHGEHYIQGHPLLEASIVYFAIWIVLFATFGAVQ